MVETAKRLTYTKVPNYILEDYISRLKGSELKVLLTVCRKTFGFHKTVDGISISQIQRYTGLGRSTIIGAIRSLVDQNIISRFEDSFTNRYGINTRQQVQKPNQYAPKEKDTGTFIDPEMVQKFNQMLVQKMNPQKKDSKEIKRNTSSSFSKDDVLKIMLKWNNLFNEKLDPGNAKDVEMIKSALYSFSADELSTAMVKRSTASYYHDYKPWLLYKLNPDYSPRNLVMGKAKLK